MRFFLYLLFSCFTIGFVYSQHPVISVRDPLGNLKSSVDAEIRPADSLFKSIMQEESEYYASLNHTAEEYYSINQPAEVNHSNRSNCELSKMVFGWHPYWQNGVESNYDWDLISDFCYFSYEVDPSTGNANSTHSFSTINSVDTALAKGLNVHLCVTLFSSHATFFSSPTAQTTLINNLINLLNTRGAHGINIDFEGLPLAQSANFTNFMINLCNAIHANDPNMKVSVCLYAVDWSNVFDEVTLSQYVDFFTIMGYDYYWSGSSQAGPTDPLYGFTSGYDRSLSRTITYYTNAGIPANKLVLGLPYYGKEWQTTSNTIPSATVGFTANRTYAYVKNNTSGYYINPVYNVRSVSKAYVFQVAGNWRQCWLTEQYEMQERYDLVNQRDLLGIAIWALGYDDGYTELWEAIENKLTDCEVVACTDTIYDGGGPEMDYYDNESYTYTISPDWATSLSLTFSSFETEAGYDTLFIYDGPDVASPLIGAYTGLASPGTVNSTGPSLTLRFKSDVSTRAPGWMAIWTCLQDNVPPITEIQPTSNWVVDDENISFYDQDNVHVQSSFWNVADLNGEWHSNINEGFAFDEFNELLPEWISVTGTWNQGSGSLIQSDESLANTNMYLDVDQNNHDIYLYEWRARTGGAGTNRRTGFHFMCDNPALPNRGNSYFVWFRPDQSELQFYKVISDVFSLVHTISFNTVINTWYNYKVVYNKISGRIDVFVDDVHVGYWQDGSPLTVGNAVSFRTGNATFEIDEFITYRNRPATDLITVGDMSSMLRYQNPHPDTPAGRIQSVVLDDIYLLGYDTLMVNVDFTSPQYSLFPTEELIDADTIINLADFPVYVNIYNDPHSGGEQTFAGLGTSPGADDVLPFTLLGLGDSVIVSTSGLISGNYYYTNVYSVNHAGLISDTTSSDGFLFINTASIQETGEELNFYPNPAQSVLMVNSLYYQAVALYDVHGKIIFTRQLGAGTYSIPVNEISSGYYFLSLNGKRYKVCVTH